MTKLSETFTHEVEGAFSTQLPKGMDAKTYDSIFQKMDEHVGSEASAGRNGAEDRLELAVRLKLECPELADMSWRQLVQVDAYKDMVSHINAKYGKAKSAYSNHLTELRESRDQLREFFLDRFGGRPEETYELVNEWYLDPNREKSGGGKKKIVTEPNNYPESVVDEPDDSEVDDSTVSLVGLMSSTAVRLNNEPIKDMPPEFLNQVNDLIRAAERAKASYITWMRSSGT